MWYRQQGAGMGTVLGHRAGQDLERSSAQAAHVNINVTDQCACTRYMVHGAHMVFISGLRVSHCARALPVGNNTCIHAAGRVAPEVSTRPQQPPVRRQTQHKF